MRIIIDPGHGGTDPGALNFDLDLKEKDLTLAIGRRFEETLSRMGYDTVMTRNSDTYVSLLNRAKFAIHRKGDILISIHINSTESLNRDNIEGLETYYWAFDEFGRQLPLNHFTMRKADSLDLLRNFRRNSDLSAKLARTLHSFVLQGVNEKEEKLTNRMVKTGDFEVLRLSMAKIPAALIELGFISCPKDAKNLSLLSFQQTIAESLAEGVDDFVANL